MCWAAAFEHDPSGFGKRQAGLNGFLIQAEVPQDRAVARVRCVADRNLGEHAGAPPQSEDAGAVSRCVPGAVSALQDAFLEFAQGLSQPVETSGLRVCLVT